MNTRLVHSLHSIGKGTNVAKMFYAIMNAPAPLRKFEKLIAILETAVLEVSEDSMKVERAVKENYYNCHGWKLTVRACLSKWYYHCNLSRQLREGACACARACVQKWR